MAKTSLDWFKLDCQLDDKFGLIEADFGLKGFAVIVKLFQKIYGMQGYYCEWTNDVALLFAKSVGLSGNVVSEIVSAAIKRGIFDRTLFENYSILTSRGIQLRYLDVASRRKSVQLKSEYLLLEVAQIPKNVDISSENVDISKKNVDIFEQSRREEKRVDESRREYADFVRLSPTEHQSLIDEFGELDTKRCIDELSLWKKKKGSTKSIDDHATIKRWVIDRVKELKAKGRYDSDDSSFNADDVEVKSLEKYRK